MLNCNAFSSHPIFYLQQSSRCVHFGGGESEVAEIRHPFENPLKAKKPLPG